MVSRGPSISVFLESLFVFSQVVLLKMELIFSFLNFWDLLHIGWFESLIWSESWLEVHPVLACVVVVLLKFEIKVRHMLNLLFWDTFSKMIILPHGKIVEVMLCYLLWRILFCFRCPFWLAQIYYNLGLEDSSWLLRCYLRTLQLIWFLTSFQSRSLLYSCSCAFSITYLF